jgi:hypothetical protein
MVREPPRADSFARDKASPSESRESGTRPIAHHVATPEPDGACRESQRPTIPVPAAASLVAYRESPPRIQDNAVAVGARSIEEGLMAPLLMAPLLMAPPFGSVDRVPYVIATMDVILSATLDHCEGFVLSLVDGHSNVDSLLDTSPMSTHETLRILLGLEARGLIALRDPTSRPP